MGKRTYLKNVTKSSGQENYFSQIVNAVRSQAIKLGLVNSKQLDLYIQGLGQAEMHIDRRRSERGGDKKEFQRRVAALNLISDSDLLAIAKLAAIESLLSHAYRSADLASREEPLKNQFKILIGQISKKKKLEKLKRILSEMIISYTHTMHPTIHETPYATAFLTEVTSILETKGKSASLERPITEFIKGVIAGEDITPTKQITVEDETRVEEENLYKIAREIDNIVEYWNEAVEEYAFENGDDDEIRKLSLNAQDRKRIFEERSWGKGGADADGRPKSTSLLLNRAINDSVIEGKYTGPKLDLRQNAKVHADLVSSLIQRKYQTSISFANLCEQFNKSSKGKKFSAKKVIYTMLPDENKAEFLKLIITDCNESLVSKEVLNYIKDFNEKFYGAFKSFLAERKLEPEISFSQMASTEAKGFYPGTTLLNVLSEQMHKLGYELEDSGSYQPSDRTFPHRNYLMQTWKYADGKLYSLEGRTGEREEMMETVKRLVVINNMIKKYGSGVSDRYQIANFSGAHNFYEVLLLFKETGIATIKDGKVSSTKLGIQPLLETLEDMQAAAKTFGELLRDPLAVSYYKARGCAEFMLGFSDGAKSAGNFASEWQIHKVAEELQKLFASHGIKTRFFEGRGRGVSRGGLLDRPEIARHLMPAEVTKSAVFDHTIQSDQPHEAAIDPAFGERYFASAFTGTINLALESQIIKKEDKKILDFLAKTSADYFQEHIRNNPKADNFLSGISLNPDIASRSPTRGKSLTYEKTRAIPIELKQTFAELPFHYVGLKTALFAYINNKSFGNPEENFARLRKMSEENPFFKYFIIRALVGMKHYHSDVAETYGEKTSKEASSFVQEAVTELDGLRALLQIIKDGDSLEMEKLTFPEIIDTYAHMMIAVANGRETQEQKAGEKIAKSTEAARLFMTIMVADNNQY